MIQLTIAASHADELADLDHAGMGLAETLRIAADYAEKNLGILPRSGEDWTTEIHNISDKARLVITAS